MRGLLLPSFEVAMFYYVSWQHAAPPQAKWARFWPCRARARNCAVHVVRGETIWKTRDRQEAAMGAALGDLFYPGNPARRLKVVAMTQKLYDYMKSTFRATNSLCDFLNSHLKGSNFYHIEVDDHKTVRDNCHVLLERIHQVQAVVGRIDEKIKEQLDPELYEKLQDEDISLNNRAQIAENVLHVVAGVVGTALAVAVCVAIASGGILAPLVAAIGVVATSAIASVVIGTIGGIALDAIFQAIASAVERDQLEDSIRKLEEANGEFIPASERYTDTIWQVLAEFKIHFLHCD